MMVSATALHIGPLMLPWQMVLLLTGLVLVYGIGRYFRHKQQWPEPSWRIFSDSLWTSFWVGLIAARLVFVLMHADLYLATPLDIIKIQDKGFHFYGGLIAGIGWFLWKNRSLANLPKAILIALFVAIQLCLNWGIQSVLPQQNQYPDLQFQNLQQQQVSLQHWVGKPTVINLWASWCPPCHREMPVLHQAQQDYPDIHFVMLNQGETPDTVQDYLRQHRLNFQHVLFDPQGDMTTQMNMYGLPSTLFFNAQGQLVHRHMGELTQPMLRRYINDLSAPSSK
ncbi:TlpA family protein disulfide reductase [Acinetobacter indicus]|uniref:TlpA disulfide reductase family protein n=1 Tax=Acinetobacter indicus TaxID=756892 RepID=UPI0012664AB9|nr:TlpA disulfide reductase family protein [Acinetobacter indicus]QFS17361.1 TlpA family protein disulfide reductase [Acinetobacter indicus]UNW05625.1 redoxin domain-containing protein [Acinetobacter indicus]